MKEIKITKVERRKARGFREKIDLHWDSQLLELQHSRQFVDYISVTFYHDTIGSESILTQKPPTLKTKTRQNNKGEDDNNNKHNCMLG